MLVRTERNWGRVTGSPLYSVRRRRVTISFTVSGTWYLKVKPIVVYSTFFFGIPVPSVLMKLDLNGGVGLPKLFIPVRDLHPVMAN